MSALTQAQYRRLTARQLTGSRARLLRAVQILAGIRVPAGTLVTITGKYAGLEVALATAAAESGADLGCAQPRRLARAARTCQHAHGVAVGEVGEGHQRCWEVLADAQLDGTPAFALEVPSGAREPALPERGLLLVASDAPLVDDGLFAVLTAAGLVLRRFESASGLWRSDRPDRAEAAPLCEDDRVLGEVRAEWRGFRVPVGGSSVRSRLQAAS